MIKNKQIVLGAIIISVTLILSGCGCTDYVQKKAGEKVAEKMIESQTGGNVDIDSQDGKVTYKSNEGSMTVSGGSGAKLPDNFPQSIFVYEDAKITFSMAGLTGGNSYSVAYVTNAKPEEVFSKYKEEMVSRGWKKESEIDMGTQGKMLNFRQDKQSIVVTAGVDTSQENKGKTIVSITGGDDINPGDLNTNSSSGSDGSGVEMDKTL